MRQGDASAFASITAKTIFQGDGDSGTRDPLPEYWQRDDYKSSALGRGRGCCIAGPGGDGSACHAAQYR